MAWCEGVGGDLHLDEDEDNEEGQRGEAEDERIFVGLFATLVCISNGSLEI